LGADYDVLEYEKLSFENLFSSIPKNPKAFEYLLQSENVLPEHCISPDGL
jgi:D-3-phosphoglycerate dehydrogenase